MSKPEARVSETLKKAQSWELQIWSEDSGYDYVEIYLDDVVDIIDSIKFLEKENKRYRERLKEIGFHAYYDEPQVDFNMHYHHLKTLAREELERGD